MPNALRSGLLGPLQVPDEAGRVVPVGGRQLRVLLTLLALNAGRVAPTGSLAEQIWPDDPPGNPGNALQTLVSRLRAELRHAGLGNVIESPADQFCRPGRRLVRGAEEPRRRPPGHAHRSGGGVGKTRLATEVSGRLDVPAWFVPLAPVTDPAEVAYAVLDTFGVREPVIARRTPESGSGPLEWLTTALADRDEVMILDNCEHVIEAAATLAGHVLAACPRIRIVATSRQPLRIDGETLCPVPPLPVPPAQIYGCPGSSGPGRPAPGRTR